MSTPASPRPTRPTPTSNRRLEQRVGGFASLCDALDYAAGGETGVNLYSGRGELVEAISYRQLREEALSLARRLVGEGLERGARVALLAETDRDFIVFFFACQYAGLVPVPLALPTGVGGRDGYVQQLRRQIYGAGAVMAMAPAGIMSYLAEATAELQVPYVGTAADFLALPERLVDPRPLGPGDISYLQYSSGSTRFPLGVAVPMPALMSNADRIARHGLRVGRRDRSVSWLPLYHDMGLVGFVVTPLITQSSSDLLPPQEFARRPLVWLDLIGRNRCTISYSPSFGYEICVRRAERASDLALDLSSWRAAGIGGDMIRPEVLTRFTRAFEAHGFRRDSFVASYGLAESTLAVSFADLGGGIEVDTVDRRRLADERVAEPLPSNEATESSIRAFAVCGRPLPGHRVEIRDEAGNALPDRRVGRIFVSGPSLMEGYFNQPEATAQVISADGWLDTGDMGYLVGGRLVVTGRSKDLIIVNGRNIWPQDIEWAVERLPGLRSGDVAAFSVDEDGSGESVIVLVQCRASDPAAVSTLVRDVRGMVNRAAALDCAVIPVPPRSLPQTSSGKLSRSKAKQNYLSGAYRPIAAREMAASLIAAE